MATALKQISAPPDTIEALNAKIGRAVRARRHCPSDEAAAKLLYLILNRSEEEWRMSPRHTNLPAHAANYCDRFAKKSSCA